MLSVRLSLSPHPAITNTTFEQHGDQQHQRRSSSSHRVRTRRFSTIIILVRGKDGAIGMAAPAKRTIQPDQAAAQESGAGLAAVVLEGRALQTTRGTISDDWCNYYY